MAAVASAAGLSEGTLYNYFRDKQDLQLRVSLGVFEAYTLEMEKVVAELKSLRHGLEGIIAVELRLLIGAKELFRIWLREMRSASGYAHSEARNALRRFSTHLIHLFAKWNARAGSPARPEPAAAARHRIRQPGAHRLDGDGAAPRGRHRRAEDVARSGGSVSARVRARARDSTAQQTGIKRPSKLTARLPRSQRRRRESQEQS